MAGGIGGKVWGFVKWSFSPAVLAIRVVAAVTLYAKPLNENEPQPWREPPPVGSTQPGSGEGPGGGGGTCAPAGGGGEGGGEGGGLGQTHLPRNNGSIS